MSKRHAMIVTAMQPYEQLGLFYLGKRFDLATQNGIPVLAIDPKGDLANLLLTFPGLTAAEFQPWVPKTESAAAQAESWRAGLAEWGQDGVDVRLVALVWAPSTA